jgi:hypothetical protein
MIDVSLRCRECDTNIKFASAFEPNKGTEIEDTQAHADVMFVFRCGSCFSRDWEVTEVSHFEFKKLPDVRYRDQLHAV